MKELIRFIKTSGIYMVGNILTKAITFFMLPIYTKYLSPTDYGIYDVNIAYITFLSSVLFLDIWSGILRYMFDYQIKEEKRKPILSGLIIFTASTILYAIFSFTLGSIMSIDYIFWVFLYGLALNLQQLFAYIIRGFAKNALFAISGLVGSIVTVVFNVVFIALLHYSYQFLYVASILGSIVNILILLSGVNIFKLLKRDNLDWHLTLDMLIFSLPLTINSISWWFLTAFNRVILTNTLSSAANGLYAIANKFSAIVQLVDQAFQMAWQEISFSKGGSKDKNQDAFFSSAINEYIKFMAFGIAILLPIIKIIFPYFVNEAFDASLKVIPLALIATLLSSISTFLGGTLTAIKKNRYLFTTTIAGTVVNIIVVYATIGILQVQAASLALGAGYLAVDFRRYALLKKYIGLKIKGTLLLGLTILLIISVIIFWIGNILFNAVAFFSFFCLMLYLYKDLIVKFISDIKIRKD